MSRFSDYLKAISQINDLGNGLSCDVLKNLPLNSTNAFKMQWLFYCGMLFSSRDKWWGDFKYRQSAHEGIDITFYRLNHKIHSFNDSIKIPAMEDGIVLNICDDFLAKSLVIKQKTTVCNGQILFVYAHLIPKQDLKPGQIIKKNEVLATICKNSKNPQLPPHLHFSCFEVPEDIRPEDLNWDFFSKSHDINLINPVFL
ncbi:MAG: M23 family metallopeptidase [Desulfobacula sp.]|nr:M23 family metallopeptidase [Desulfobacula sp.]